MCGSCRYTKHHHSSSYFALITRRNREQFRAKFSESAPLLHQSSEYLARIQFERAGQVDELDHIDAALADLDAGDYRLGGLQPPRELVLRKFGGLAGGNEGCAQGAVTRAAKTLQVQCSR